MENEDKKSFTTLLEEELHYRGSLCNEESRGNRDLLCLAKKF